MLFDGIKLVEGSELQNLVVASGTAFPSNPDQGELFYHTGDMTYDEGLYVRNGTQWHRCLREGEDLGDVLLDIVTPGTYRSVTVDSKGLVTAGSNPTTLSGYGITDAQPLDGDLTAIAEITATTGLLRKTAANTWTLDTASYITGNQTITLSGDVSGSGSTAITATLANTAVAPGSYGSATAVGTFTVDAKGRITNAANTSISIDASAVTSGTFINARISETSVTQHEAALSITESQIADGSILARVAGSETISGTWSFTNPVTIPHPSSSMHAATKQYVDTIAQGLQTKPAVEVVSTSNLTATYNNGTGGVGATLTGTGAFPTIDGVTLTSTTLGSNGVLVAGQTNPAHNGRYNLTQVNPWVLTRCALCDEASEIPGSYTFVKQGTQYATSGWVQTVANPSTFVVGTDAITVTQFSGAGSYTGSTGIDVTGTVISLATSNVSSLFSLAANGLVVRNAANSVVARTITGGTNIAVTNGDGVSGNPTVAFTGVLPLASGGTGATSAADARTSLGATTVGSNFFTLSNPAAIRFVRINADNTVDALDAASFRTAIGAGTGTGTVTSIDVATSGVGITSSGGPITSSGTITITSNATSANTASTVVARDASGNFSAGTITAALTGTASGNLALGGGTLTGALGIIAGAVDSPSIFVTGSTTTGLYSPSTNNLSITTNGVQRFNVTATGEAQFFGTTTEAANNRGSISGAQTLDLALGNYISATITGATTFSFTNPPASGRVGSFILELTNGGSATITWPGSITWVAGSAPTLRTSGINLVGLITRNGGTTYLGTLLA